MAFKIQLCCSRSEGETKKRKDGSKAPHKALKYLKGPPGVGRGPTGVRANLTQFFQKDKNVF